MVKTALLFPGQGSQELGMGRDLAEKDSSIMDLWRKAEEISGIELREIYWDGDEKAMPKTEYLQPALTTVNLSIWQALSKKLSPACTAGHSLGELSALGAARVLPIDDLISLATLRGKLMSQADPKEEGAMAALVRIDLDKTKELVEKVQKNTGEMLVIANYNTPGQYVVSGTKKSIENIGEEVKKIKGRAITLAVSGAFHSPMMKEASNEFTDAINALDKGKWNNAIFPVYSNSSATSETDREAIKDNFIMQMTSSVFWIDSIRNQWDSGVKVFVECGPKQVLSKMVGQILKDYTEEEAKSLSVDKLEALENFKL